MVAIISHADFQDSLSCGKHWIAIDSNVYDITGWYNFHPGGKIVLFHSRGRDVSEAFHAYHPWSVCQRLPAFKIGQLAGTSPQPCISAASPIQAQSNSDARASETLSNDLHSHSKRTQQSPAAHDIALKAVQHALEAQGLFHTSLCFYSQLALGCTACLAFAVWLIVQQHIVPGALLLGLFWQQVCHSMLVDHDSCHISLCCFFVLV